MAWKKKTDAVISHARPLLPPNQPLRKKPEREINGNLCL